MLGTVSLHREEKEYSILRQSRYHEAAKEYEGQKSWQSRYHEAAEKKSLFAAFRQLGRTQDKERNEREKKKWYCEFTTIASALDIC